MTMSASQTAPTGDRVCSDWPAMAREVGPRFAARASSHGATDSVVADNYRALRGSAQLTYAGRVALGLDVNESNSTGDVRKEQAT